MNPTLRNDPAAYARRVLAAQARAAVHAPGTFAAVQVARLAQEVNRARAAAIARSLARGLSPEVLRLLPGAVLDEISGRIGATPEALRKEGGL